jgi:hypothetical protein
LERLPSPAAVVLAFVFNAVLAERASAHVKWFCAYDVAGQPRGLERVLCPEFELLVGVAMLALLVGCFTERTRLGEAMVRALDRATVTIRENTEFMFRAGAAAFFVSLWAIGGILLTPELKTSDPAVSWLQFAIAVGMVSRQTMPFSALGIVVLFGVAVYQYGAFHLADYPIFLGVAAYLALTGLQRDIYGIRPLDIVRYAAAITLMWASIEKWAYPEWSFPLLERQPTMLLGYDRELFMRAAGVIEFTLAFALLWTPLVRRFAAIMLAGMFISAIIEFGKIDAIGHSMIIIALLAFIADDKVADVKTQHPLVTEIRRPWFAPVGFVIALGWFLVVYYATHSAMFGSRMI